MIAIDGQHYDLNIGKLFFELGGAGDARLSGQMNIHQDDVGFQPRDFSQSFLRGGAGKDAAKPLRRINPLTDCLSHHCVVFDDCYGIHGPLWATGIGSCRVTVVPEPGDESTSHWPLKCSSRLRRFASPCPFERSNVSKPPPLSVIEIDRRFPVTLTRKPISVAEECRTALLRASFTARNK